MHATHTHTSLASCSIFIHRVSCHLSLIHSLLYLPNQVHSYVPNVYHLYIYDGKPLVTIQSLSHGSTRGLYAEPCHHLHLAAVPTHLHSGPNEAPHRKKTMPSSHTRVGSDDPLLGQHVPGIDAITTTTTNFSDDSPPYSPQRGNGDGDGDDGETTSLKTHRPTAKESVIPQDSRLRRTFSPWSSLGLGFRHEISIA